MGCCALESGDAISAIPVRKLISLRGSASPLQPRGGIMTKSKRRHPERDFTPTHPNAAAIDIGSRMHVAAVPPDLDRRFAAVGRLVRALRRANGRDGVHRRLLDTCLRTA